MICKYCGTKVDPESEICPKCGKRGNKREGGNGFWDIARGPALENQPAPVVDEEQKRIARYIPVAICGLLCIVSIVIAVIGVASSNNRIKALRESYDTQLAEQARQFSEENNNLQLQIDQLTDQLAGISVRSTQVVESLRILSSPTPETREIGFQSTPGFYLFGLRVEGQVASFRWEKQQQNGDWVTITFDESRINRELGLRLEESITDGTSRLVAIGLTPYSFGTYKCTAIGINGAVQYATVELINSSEEMGETEDTTSATDPTDDGSDPDSGEDYSVDTDSTGSEQKGGWW